MIRTTSESDAALRQSTPTPAERLITFREVYVLTGMSCKTAHTCRAWAAKGLIRGVKITSRCVRYGEASVHALVAGRGAA